MQKVFKYQVPMKDYFSLALPKNAKILTIQVQHGLVQLWVLVNPDSPAEVRNFRLVGTDFPIAENPGILYYIGTIQLAKGTLILHLFEIKEQRTFSDHCENNIEEGIEK